MDDVALAVVTALATKGADTVAAGGRSAVSALRQLIRSRFSNGTETTLLADFEARPDEAGARGRFAAALLGAMSHDPTFAAECSALVGSPLSVNHGGVVNVVGGRAERTIQAQSIFGDVRL